jgi:hypothetical protein
MTTDVFLAPCDPGNFDRTALEEIELDEYEDHPEALSGLETVRFWGVREGSSNRGYFEKMSPGDLVLFYQDSRYIGVGWIGSTFEDEEGWASETFWNGAPSKLIYTLEEFVELSVPRASINNVFDYLDGYYPQGLTRVARNRVDRRPAAIKAAAVGYTEKHS